MDWRGCTLLCRTRRSSMSFTSRPAQRTSGKRGGAISRTLRPGFSSNTFDELRTRSFQTEAPMKIAELFSFTALGLCIAVGAESAAQVQTEVPPVVSGAKPVSVEHIKVHGAALEGNLEG